MKNFYILKRLLDEQGTIWRWDAIYGGAHEGPNFAPDVSIPHIVLGDCLILSQGPKVSADLAPEEKVLGSHSKLE
jgi:hypothetical protein